LESKRSDPIQRGTELLIGALLAALRLKLMASDLGYELDTRTVIAATSAGIDPPLLPTVSRSTT
jgi:hypothetical protein